MKLFIFLFICAASMVVFTSKMATVENTNAKLTHKQGLESSPVDDNEDYSKTPRKQVFQSRIFIQGKDEIMWDTRTYFSTDAMFVINFSDYEISEDNGFGCISWQSKIFPMSVYTRDGIIEHIDMLDSQGYSIKRYYATKP